MEGRNARRTEKLHRGGAGKGEGAAGKRIRNRLYVGVVGGAVQQGAAEPNQ